MARDPELFIVGQRASLTCTSDLDDLTSMEWLNRDGVMLASSENSQSVVLEFDPVNDSIHNLRYICRAVTPVGNQDQHDRILVEGMYIRTVLFYKKGYKCIMQAIGL